MNQSEFGKLLRNKRQEHHKTQEEIANSINKNKMLISGMETGKNNPPIGDDLKNIMECLGLNEEEEKEFKIIAALERGTLPNELITLVKDDKRIIDILYKIKEKKLTNEKYEKINKILK